MLTSDMYMTASHEVGIVMNIAKLAYLQPCHAAGLSFGPFKPPQQVHQLLAGVRCTSLTHVLPISLLQ